MNIHYTVFLLKVLPLSTFEMYQVLMRVLLNTYSISNEV